MGSTRLERHAKAHLGVDWGQTTGDGEFSLEPVFCLGNCALSPAVMVDEQLFGRVDPRRFEAILAGIAGAPDNREAEATP